MQKVVVKRLTASNSDVLANSDIEAAPRKGVFSIRAASTAATETMSIHSNGFAGIVTTDASIQMRANAEVRSYDQAYVIPVLKGDKVTINYTLVTSSQVCRIEIVFNPQ
jgi:hypothetical protein